MNKAQINEALQKIIAEKLAMKAKLEELRGLQELTNKSFEHEINERLDRISLLNKLETELGNLKKTKNN